MTLALMGFVAILGLAFVGLPLGFSMMAVGTGFFALLRGWEPALIMAAQTISDLAANDGLSVLPMFILMGTFIYKADLAEELYDAAYALFGHRRGGLAYATVLSSAGFAAISGSSIATAATMTKVAMPPMRRHRYADSLATGCISSGGTLGALIPPSVPLLIYGVVMQQDIGKLFVAGIGPGILVCVGFMASVWWTVRRKPEAGPAGERSSWKYRFEKLSKVWPVVLLFLLVVGGLYTGVFTATEAAGVGAVGAMLFALYRGKLSRAVFLDALVESGKTTAMIFVIAFGGLIFANYITMSGLTGALVDSIEALHFPVLGVICVLVLIYVVLGALMESLSMMLLTVPVFAAIVQPMGVDMIWFGVFVVMMIEIGMITPPVGMNAFMVKSMLPDVSLATVFKGTAPFLLSNFVTLALVIVFPGIALWLVKAMG